MTLVVRGASHRIQVLGDPRETKIRDPCMAGDVNKDIWLGAVNTTVGRIKTITYSLEITVDYVAGVEVVEAVCDIR